MSKKHPLECLPMRKGDWVVQSQGPKSPMRVELAKHWGGLGIGSRRATMLEVARAELDLKKVDVELKLAKVRKLLEEVEAEAKEQLKEIKKSIASLPRDMLPQTNRHPTTQTKAFWSNFVWQRTGGEKFVAGKSTRR